jgi:hypothetical protein
VRTRRFKLPSRRSARALRGLVHLEVIVSLGLALTLIALFAAAILSYAAARREGDLRRTLQLAASAELDRVRAGLRPVPAAGTPAESATEPGPLLVSLGAEDGTGVWAGLRQVRAVASKRVGPDRVVRVELQAYVAPGGAP